MAPCSEPAAAGHVDRNENPTVPPLGSWRYRAHNQVEFTQEVKIGGSLAPTAPLQHLRKDLGFSLCPPVTFSQCLGIGVG